MATRSIIYLQLLHTIHLLFHYKRNKWFTLYDCTALMHSISRVRGCRPVSHPIACTALLTQGEWIKQVRILLIPYVLRKKPRELLKHTGIEGLREILEAAYSKTNLVLVRQSYLVPTRNAQVTAEGWVLTHTYYTILINRLLIIINRKLALTLTQFPWKCL